MSCPPGIAKPAISRDRAAGRAIVSAVRWPSASHSAFCSSAFSRGVDQIAAFRLQLRQERVVDRRSTSRLPSAEQPEPWSLVLLMRVLRAASAMSAVSSITIVALPAPTP